MLTKRLFPRTGSIASLPFDRDTATTWLVPSAIGALVVLLLTALLWAVFWVVAEATARRRFRPLVRVPGIQGSVSPYGSSVAPRGRACSRPGRFCERMDVAAPKGERIAVDNAKFEQFMFDTRRKTAAWEVPSFSPSAQSHFTWTDRLKRSSPENSEASPCSTR